MGEIEVFQRDIADVIVVRHLYVIVVALTVRPGNGTVAHLDTHILGQNVLAVKEVLQRTPVSYTHLDVYKRQGKGFVT